MVNEPVMPDERLSRDKILTKQLGLILSIAGVLKFIYLFIYSNRIPFSDNPVLDSELYHELGSAIAGGALFSDKIFYHPPLYSYYLGLLYSLFGIKPYIALVSQVLLGVVNLFLIYLATVKLTNKIKAGYIAMIMAFFYAPFSFIETKLLAETLAISLSLISLCILLEAIKKRSYRLYLNAGLFLGLACLTRSSILLFIPVLALWLFVKRNLLEIKWAAALSMTIGASIFVISWATLYNYIAEGDFVLINANGGITFHHSNNPTADGLLIVPEELTSEVKKQEREEIQIAELETGRRMKRSEVIRFWYRKGFNFIKNNPKKFLLLEMKKLGWLIAGYEFESSYNLYLEKREMKIIYLLFIPFGMLLGFGAMGYLWAKNESKQLLLLWCLSVSYAIMIFHFNTRYRLLLVPELAIFSGIFFSSWKERFKENKTKCLVKTLIGLIIALISMFIYGGSGITSQSLYSFGLGYYKRGDAKKAISLYREAIELNPHSPIIHNDLGVAYKKVGNFSEAKKEYEISVREDPRLPQAHYNLANSFRDEGAYEKAIYHYKEAIKYKNDLFQAYFNLASIYKKLGKDKEADYYIRMGKRAQHQET